MIRTIPSISGTKVVPKYRNATTNDSIESVIAKIVGTNREASTLIEAIHAADGFQKIGDQIAEDVQDAIRPYCPKENANESIVMTSARALTSAPDESISHLILNIDHHLSREQVGHLFRILKPDGKVNVIADEMPAEEAKPIPGKLIKIKKGGTRKMQQSIIDGRNQYKVKGNIASLTITDRNGKSLVVKFDVDMMDQVRRHCWRIISGRGKRYAASGTGTSQLFLHHLILPPNDGKVVFFRDGDERNCQRKNLAMGTRSEMVSNGIKDRPSPIWSGALLKKNRGYWEGVVAIGKKKRSAGRWGTKAEAEQASKELAEELRKKRGMK